MQENTQPADRSDGHDFRVTEHPLEGPGTVLAVTGELDIATAPTFRSQLNEILDRGQRRLVIDMTQVSFVDSVALAVLLAAVRRLGDEGRIGFVVAPDSYGMLIFEASGMDAVLAVFQSHSEAVAYVQG